VSALPQNEVRCPYPHSIFQQITSWVFSSLDSLHATSRTATKKDGEMQLPCYRSSQVVMPNLMKGTSKDIPDHSWKSARKGRSGIWSFGGSKLAGRKRTRCLGNGSVRCAHIESKDAHLLWVIESSQHTPCQPCTTFRLRAKQWIWDSSLREDSEHKPPAKQSWLRPFGLD
jgi:hypothetical protein